MSTDYVTRDMVRQVAIGVVVSVVTFYLLRRTGLLDGTRP